MKIYIMGCPGSGKTTLAKKLSRKYNINYYELDLLVYDDENGHIKRSNDEVNKMFNEILSRDSFIIEDVGRSRFLEGRIVCDKIYYIKISKFKNIIRVIKRWIRQRNGSENYNYPPTFLQFFDMLGIVFCYFRKEKQKIKSLTDYMDKVVFLDEKALDRLIK